ncbi:Alpha-D-glucose-1-phosphate phosphatase [Lecanosticta acicola]|uniref:Alpha-D-glucose-1-phosphate phosphatase n=1 Tax=Lecanosticta acicola TaxID=111012 RepID=A0AAI9E7K6_9PEZI|nr:Alpha-D-glucose-1-phosphate phosphatase [Lecanosticta acicola]
MDTRMPVKLFVFDLGDVLFHWSATTTTSIPAKTLHAILKSDFWLEFDCGRITQQQCYEQAGRQFSYSSGEIQEAFAQARASLQPNIDMVASIQALRRACRGTVQICAMSNVSKEDYLFMEPTIHKWDVFDRIFTSGHAGMRKPDSSFYRHVLRETKLQPQEVVFIDDKLENVLAAQSLGIRAFVFSETEMVIDILRRIRDDPVERGYRFLSANASADNLHSITDSGVVVPDNFAKLLIQDTIPSCRYIVPQWDKKRTWNFFDGTPVLVPGKVFPDDLDTTSLALTVIPPAEDLAHSLLDEMLLYVHEDGRLQTYFDWDRPRVDEIVSANVLTCFYRYGRGRQLAQTLEMIRDVLVDRSYESGTRYYPHADCCLYFIARLLNSSNEPEVRGKLERVLRERVAERVGREGGAIELAMRIINCCEFGISCRGDVSALLQLQEEDGGWPASWMYRYGSTGVQLGNRGVTTAMAIKALSSL